VRIDRKLGFNGFCLESSLVDRRRSCGAEGDELPQGHAAIQRAIDTCNEKVGGPVHFSAPVRYRSGTILLKDNVTLRLDPQAVLLGSKTSPITSAIEAFTDAVGMPRGHCFIGAVDAKNIGVSEGRNH